MNPPQRKYYWLFVVMLMAPALCAQEPAAVRRTVLPSLDSQVAARLIALDRRLNPAGGPDLAASLVAQLGPAPLNVFTPLLADARNTDVWDQLPEEYYRITQESGDALATLAESPPHLGVGWSSGQVRRLCHQRLAALPRASLAQYRQRVDAEAKALLEQGRRERSPAPLRRIADELFCSTHAETALDLLGDLAFEKGQFDEARHWWSLLAPLDGVRDDRLVFPQAKLDPARVQAKQILALIFQGRLDEAQVQIPRFLQLQPKARGQLAGQDDLYAVILQKTLLAFARERLRNNDEPWTTFGGDATRNRTLSQGLSWQLWEDGPAWRVPLPILNAKDAPPDRAHASRRAAFHPVIVNHQVLIADQRSVVSYHLTTGKELFRFEPKGAGLNDLAPGIDSKAALPRFTLSADHERAYVRLGKLGMAPGKEAASYLICIDLTQPGVVKERELWRVPASADDKSPAFFEGSPLVHDGRVYIGLSKIVGRHVVTSIICYDVLGRKRWAREVCDCPEFEDHVNGGRHRQHLLTLAGGQIVYCSHAGAIVAVDAWTGQPTWGARYPSRGPVTGAYEPSPRDLAPALYADGLVFAAPFDSDRIYCLDAVTGQLRWELDAIEVVHLLGVAHGRLFAATRNGVMAIHAASGRADWSQPTEGRLPSLGRGLIAGGWLIWPTQDTKLPYRAVTLRGGAQQKDGDAKSVLPEPDTMDPAMLHTLPVGNLAFGQGCLVIAGLSELVVYVPAHKIKDLPPPDARPDARIKLLYDRARRLASAGHDDEAAQIYRQLLDATKLHPRAADWRALIESRVGRERKQPQGAPVAKAPVDVKQPPVPAGPALPLVRAWSHEDGKVWPTDADEFFFCTQPGKVTCRARADGSLRWQTNLDFEPAWFGRSANLVLISGPDAVEALRVDDGKPAWTFVAPSRQWRLGSVVKGSPTLLSPTAGIVHVERWDDTLLVLDDHRRIYRLRLDTGEIVWQYASPAAALRPLDGAAIGPHVATVGNRLWVQSVTGQPYWLDAKAAKPTATQTGAPSRPWPQPPLVIGNSIILATDGGRVIANVKTPPHERLWTYQAPWPTSLTGEPCRLFNKGGVLLALVPRNEGYDCVRLEVERGTVTWSIPARQLPSDLDLASVCIGDLSLYYVHDGKLHARSLNDGALQWTQILPTRSLNWRLRYTKDYLAVYPTAGSQDDVFSVSFIDPWDGSLLQRLAPPEAHGPGDVLLTPRHVVVSAGGRIYGFHSLDRE